jgi:hypothetical protein
MKNKIREVREVKEISIKKEVKNEIHKVFEGIFHSISLRKFFANPDTHIRFREPSHA